MGSITSIETVSSLGSTKKAGYPVRPGRGEIREKRKAMGHFSSLRRSPSFTGEQDVPKSPLRPHLRKRAPHEKRYTMDEIHLSPPSGACPFLFLTKVPFLKRSRTFAR